MLNYYLLGGLITVYFISSMANGWLRDSSAELDGDVRERVFQSEARMGWVWRTAEFLGFVLIIGGMFRPMLGLRFDSQLVIAGGLFVFCLSNSVSAWFSDVVYHREAPNTKASSTARRAAVIITLAEIALLSFVAWTVAPSLGWKSSSSTSNTKPANTSKQDTGVWIPESTALKELSHFPREYIQGLVETGKLHTKMVDGARLYDIEDVEIYKKKKMDVIPD